MSGFPPALVISLDLELHWGVRDHVRPGDPYVRALLGARSAVPQLLGLFERFGVAATWATVGLLFAANKQEASRFEPAQKPSYLDSRLDPYGESTGDTEIEDPLHFGWELIPGEQSALTLTRTNPDWVGTLAQGLKSLPYGSSGSEVSWTKSA